MMTTKRVSFVLLAVVLLLLPHVLGDYEENIREDIFLVRPDNEFIVNTTVPTYLENEDLIFFACLETENVPVRLSVLCQDTNEFEDVQARRWGDQNCFVGSTNLDHFDCSRALVQADYVSDGENLKLSQQIRINKFSNTLNRIIESQFSDGGWETPLDTAYGLLAISQFPDIFTERINMAIEYLKLNRNEEEKCWPADDCRISTTAAILFLLEKAGFEDLRIQHDGYLYLEKTQNYLSGDKWNITITDYPLNENNTFNTSCVYDYEGSSTVYNLGKYPRQTILNFTPAYDAYLNIVCTDNVIVNISNEFSEPLIGYQGDNFSYTIPPSCWTLNNEHIECDVRSTLYAANTPIRAAQLSAAKNYLATLLEDDRTAGMHVENNWNVFNDALFLHGLSNNEDEIITALLFYQNNSGGWEMLTDYYDRTYFEISLEDYNELEAEVTDQVSKDIVGTGYAVMALLEKEFSREDEVILDAERWVSLHEDQTTMNFTDEDLTTEEAVTSYLDNLSLILNDTKRNSMAFFVLQNNARPLLQARPRVLYMNEESKEIDIINPTIFDLDNLEYEFAPNLKPYLHVEAKDFVGGYSFRRVTINLTTKAAVNEFGYLRVLQGDNEYLKIPIIIESAPELNISLPEKVTVFGGSTVLPFSVEKSSHSFTCSLEWGTEGITSNAKFDIDSVNGTYNFPVRFAVVQTENALYEGEITCISQGVTFKIPFATNIIRFSSTPMQVFPEVISIESLQDEKWISVRNLLDESIDVEVTLAQQDPYISLSETFFNLFPGEVRNITVRVVPPTGENYTTSNSIIFQTFNVQERVLMDVDIRIQDTNHLGLFWWMIILSTLALVLGIAGYFGWKNRASLLAWYEQHFRKENIRERVLRQVHEMEREEEITALRNMIRILKLQGLSDLDVRSRLEKEGYTTTDIDDALKAPAKANAKKP